MIDFELVIVVDAEHSSGKGKYLAKGGEDGGVYLSGGWNDEGGHYHDAAKDCHRDCQNELNSEPSFLGGAFGFAGHIGVVLLVC